MISASYHLGLLISVFGLTAASALPVSTTTSGFRFDCADRGETVPALPYGARLWEKIWCPDRTGRSGTSSEDLASQPGSSLISAQRRDSVRTGQTAAPRSALAAADLPPPPGMDDQAAFAIDSLWPEEGSSEENPPQVHRTGAVEGPGVSGPSATTLLVGLTALIVCTGALFAGRQ